MLVQDNLFKSLLSSPDSLDSEGLKFDDKNENFPCCRCDWLVDDWWYLFHFSSKLNTTDDTHLERRWGMGGVVYSAALLR